MRKMNKIYPCFFYIYLYCLTVLDKKYLTIIINNVIIDNDHAMKDERCLIKKIVKTYIIFIGLIFLMGFYDERNIYVELEEITIELGSTLSHDNINYVNTYLVNSNFFLEDNVPKNENGETNKLGTYNYYIVYRDEERMYSRFTNKKSTISVIDTIKPEIRFKDNSLKFNYGSKINVSDIASCYDLSLCELSFENEIDTKTAVVKEVTVIAIDEGNNISKESISITIKEKPKAIISYPSIDRNNNYINDTLSDEELSAKRNQLIAYAKQFEGNPYVYGGTSLTNGTDCSGFTMSVYKHFGYQLPRSSVSQGYVGMAVSRNQLLPGDLIVYFYTNGGGHVGIYIGNGLMIHAGTAETGIVIAPIFSGNKVYRRIIY